MESLVSICIPVYNGEKYLQQCLDSAIGQTYRNTEIIIVDDCSSDKSGGIIEKYLGKNNRLKYFKNNQNLGLVGNWNKCIGYASGDWIKFLFQDDFLEMNCIEKLIDFADKSKVNCPVLVSKRKYLYNKRDTNLDESTDPEKWLTLEKIKLLNRSGFISAQEISNAAVKYMGINFIGEPSFVMFRKNIISKMGMFNDRFEQICDLEFFLRSACHRGIIYVPMELACFRVHENSISSLNSTEKQFELVYLEPVKFAYQLIYEGVYDELRANLSVFNRYRLKLFYYTRGYEAWSKAILKDRHKEKFISAINEFPKLELFTNSSFSGRLYNILLSFKRIF